MGCEAVGILETDESYAPRFLKKEMYPFLKKNPLKSVSCYTLSPRVNDKSHVLNFGSGGLCWKL